MKTKKTLESKQPAKSLQAIPIIQPVDVLMEVYPAFEQIYKGKLGLLK